MAKRTQLSFARDIINAASGRELDLLAQLYRSALEHSEREVLDLLAREVRERLTISVTTKKDSKDTNA